MNNGSTPDGIPIVSTLDGKRGIVACLCGGWHTLGRPTDKDQWRIVGHAMDNAEADDWMHIVR